MIKLYNGNCLEIIPTLEKSSIDMILVDPPYGTTQCKWDSILPFDQMWKCISYVVKPNTAIVMTSSQPFTSALIMSNPSMFKYNWVWDKVNRISGHLNSKKQPLRIVEDIVVFYSDQPTYNPQMIAGKPYKAVSKGNKSSCYGAQTDGVVTINNGEYYPRNLISIPADERGTVGRIHPTQKPVALMEYLIKTYTNENDVVLDFTMGSGTTGVACGILNRKFIGIELDKNYYEIAKTRIESAYTKTA
jgi:site-specific DNA-methyltransferase (adenine-specific)